MLEFPFIKGFLVSAGLIIAIGAQNAFVIRQGISKNYVFITAFICSILDFCLVSLGIFGLGAIITANSSCMIVIKWLGFGFLFLYACLSLRELLFNRRLQTESEFQKQSLLRVVLTLLAVSLLNPHVYLDTMLLIGSVGCQYEDMLDKKLFMMGSGLASTAWFFSLCFGASYFSEFLKKPIVWKFINLIIAIILFWLAISFIL